jgi:hypothetical protein
MTDTETAIALIEPRGTVVKDPNPRWYHQGPWRLDITYVLADGRRFDTTRYYRLKRDAAAELATLPAAPANPTTATINSDGQLTGTRTSFTIGAGA